MKNKLLLFLAALAASAGFSVGVQAQTAIPYLPQLADLAGSAVDLTTFSPSDRNYTLEVDGTAGSEINIANSSYTYTPSSTCKVRFAQKNGVIYVYEGSTYKTTLTPVSPTTYPDIFTDAGIYDAANLLQNPGFESLLDANSDGVPDAFATGKYTPNVWKLSNNSWEYVRANWQNSGYAFYQSGAVDVAGKCEGDAFLMFRSDASTLLGHSVYQEITAGKIKPSTWYKVKFSAFNHSNATGGTYYCVLGSSVDGQDYYSSSFKIASSTSWARQDMTFTFKTPSTVSQSSSSYFGIKNITTTQNGIVHLDRMTLVEGPTAIGITGTNSATYVDGTAYAPEVALATNDYYDMTNYITNAAVSSGTGWSNTRVGTNQQYTGAPDNTYLDFWSGSAWTYDSNQNLSGLPNGVYKLVAAVRSSVNTCYLYATAVEQSKTTIPATGNTGNTLGNGWQDVEVDNIVVTTNSLTVGVGGTAVAGSWIGTDNFRLYYYGVDLSVLQTTLSGQISTLNSYKTQVSDAVKLLIETAVGEAENVESTQSALESAIAKLVLISKVAENELGTASLIVNPSFETNSITDWTNTGFSLQGNNSFIKSGTYYVEKWVASPNALTDYNMSQSISNLPNGYYVLSAVAQSTQNGAAATGTYLYAGEGSITPEVTEIGASGTYAVTTQITNGVLNIGFKTQSTTANWVSVDNFLLTYLGTVPYVVAVTDKAASVKGAIDDAAVTEIGSALANATSADFSKAKANSAKTIPNANPNLIAYNVPANVTVDNAITAGCTKELAESYPFYAPTALTMTVSYVRSFTATSGDDVSGWQSIVVPFNVTAITAIKGGNTITLVPFSNSNWNGATESDSPRPFWLYKAKADGTGYETASSIEANVPYLISIPNNNSYADFYNVSGNVTFTGTALAVTSTTVGALPNYSIVPNFDGNKVSVYALNAAGSLWESGKSVNSFYAYATSGNSSAPKFISIFGDGEVTGIKDILSETTMTDKTVSAFAAEGGVTIVSKNPGKVAIYTDGGLLLKVVPVGEGSNFVALASGKYIVNATVVIVK